MKLELKHLAPYLPYKLDVMYNGKIIPVDGLEYCGDVFNIDIGEIPFHSLKPILRPLSDLKKRIDEDESNVTYDAFLNIDKDLDVEISVHDNDWIYVSVFEMYEKMEKLFEWHFDVFGLIEKGLSIDKNTL